MGVTPFKKMQYHEKVVKKVAFHPTYPLFASASDDGNKYSNNLGTINVFYGKISLTDLS
jgi:ribosome biogenesis protein ERB1